MTKKLYNDIKQITTVLNNLYEKIMILVIKDNELYGNLKDIKVIKNKLIDILNDIKELDSLNPDLFMCYENDIYLAVINKKYIISYRYKDSSVKILYKTSNLKKAIEAFYKYAYKTNKKELKNSLL